MEKAEFAVEESDEESRYDVCKLVWQGLENSEFLSRYYGHLAGKLTLRNQLLAVSASIASVVSALLVAQDTHWGVVVLILGTAIISAIGAIQAGQGRVTGAVYCQKEFDDLHISWVALWKTLPTLHETEALRKWGDLSHRANDISAMSPLNSVDRKLLGRSEAESHKFLSLAFEEQDDREEALPLA